MSPNPHPECPICQLMYSAQGQPLALALRVLRLADQHQCRCPGRAHRVLLKHPHAQPGCQGYEVQRSVATS